jgi:hypothetical protein
LINNKNYNNFFNNFIDDIILLNDIIPIQMKKQPIVIIENISKSPLSADSEP